MGAFGYRGDMRVKPLGRFPNRFRDLRRVYVGEEHVPAEILHRKTMGPGVLLRLSTVSSRDDARALFQQYLYVPESEAIELPPGEYFVHQIIGLTVVTTDGKTLGPIREVLETGSNDVYVVRHEGKEILIPAIKEVIQRVDLEAGIVEVTLLSGLLD
jgi:16S rRNA processing protein RimM